MKLLPEIINILSFILITKRHTISYHVVLLLKQDRYIYLLHSISYWIFLLNSTLCSLINSPLPTNVHVKLSTTFPTKSSTEYTIQQSTKLPSSTSSASTTVLVKLLTILLTKYLLIFTQSDIELALFPLTSSNPSLQTSTLCGKRTDAVYLQYGYLSYIMDLMQNVFNTTVNVHFESTFRKQHSGNKQYIYQL